MNNKKSFHESLDELMLVLKKLKENSKNLQFKDIDIKFLSDFEVMINNYELIKSSVSKEVLDDLGDPIKELIEILVIQLKEELENLFKDAMSNPKNSEDVQKDLQHVTELLKQDNLTVHDIDFLLDRRSELLQGNSSPVESLDK
ncbi:MAG: hypothetical protein IPO21_07800 [Bacteroidales bacterium]|nr:hypothetical protein [Bacteroidales bacterium]